VIVKEVFSREEKSPKTFILDFLLALNFLCHYVPFTSASILSMKKCLNLEYDVVLSFAGEDRKYVEKTASHLRRSGIRVFYDTYEEVNLWGKDLYQHLDDVYKNKGKYAVIFISEAFAKKLWTNHELKSAQARAFSEHAEYILPARFDETEIPGIRKTMGYVDLRELTPTQFAKKVIKKLGDIEPENFLPDKITFIEGASEAMLDGLAADEIKSSAQDIFTSLKLMNDREKSFLASFFLYSCKHDVSEDLHHDISYIERVSGFNREEILDIVNGLTNLAFAYKISKTVEGCEEDGNTRVYESLSIKLYSRNPDLVLVNLTPVWALMYHGASTGKCAQCAFKTLNRLDFSGLKDAIDEEELAAILPGGHDDMEPDDEE
jgi:hypothetical protein